MTDTAASPASSGPAGAVFEGQVGAHYLLTMLADAEPRGLPGSRVTKVALQRGAEGFPLDDVIIHAMRTSGSTATLEIQVKRTITFSAGDAVFKKVVEQIAASARGRNLNADDHHFAVAIARRSFKIDGPYQDVLRWARELGDPKTFVARVARKGSASDDMRDFVSTFRTHLVAAGIADDDLVVWQILRNFQILPFDYAVTESASTELAFERARRTLTPGEAHSAKALWENLAFRAMEIASVGGDRDRATLATELVQVPFQLAGTVRNRAVRDALAEAARHVLADIQQDVAGARLARTAHLAALASTRDQGRYVEIRGAAGVGKSALLRFHAEQVAEQARLVVLSPGRTIPRGWLAFKAALGIEGTAHDFLSDLACDGGATLIIDNLDFFTDENERKTVIDLVREAASIPAIHVIVSARLDFDADLPNWLPQDAITALGPAPPLIINELGVEEVEELRAAAPILIALLADDHPARPVTRNLYRLTRLVSLAKAADQLRSEIDMAELWWRTSDGAMDADQRERARILADLTDSNLGGTDTVAGRYPTAAITALINSGTLRELDLDRFTYRHDVLREWGIAARLHADPARIDKLPLNLPVPAALVRAVELTARFALERGQDGAAWVQLLERLSPAGSHASWRRAGVLAILRSEIAAVLLKRCEGVLFADRGCLLHELIRTAMAVESEPLAKTLVGSGVDPSKVPTGIFVPRNSSWTRLVKWLLGSADAIPQAALPDVVDLFESFTLALFGADPFTPKIAEQLYRWLVLAEGRHRKMDGWVFDDSFGEGLDSDQKRSLETDLRRAFSTVAWRVPAKAKEYLQSVAALENPDDITRTIIKFRGTFPRAAPRELADLILKGLVAEQESDRPRTHREPFTWLDSDFLPPSPAQGPFLDMLTHHKEEGLAFIRKLVAVAIDWKAAKCTPGEDGLTLVFPEGPRFFPWERSYFWQREAENQYAVGSALMALEAWGHQRLDRGDDAAEVIADVLGEPGAPAAFVLIALDLILSHWSKTHHLAVPFLSCPELLVLDRQRHLHDNMPPMDLGIWGGIGPDEPKGAIMEADLKSRPSRKRALESVLGLFVVRDDALDPIRLKELLEDAAARLGPPSPDANYGDPAFMTQHALNVIDPANWQFGEDGPVYVTPQAEADQVARLQAKAAPRNSDFEIESAMSLVLDQPERSTPALAEAARDYACRHSAPPEVTAPYSHALRDHQLMLVTAAMLIARDASDAFLDAEVNWVRETLSNAVAFEGDDITAQMRNGIRYNVLAIAAVGLTQLLKRRSNQRERDMLLAVASRYSAASAHGFGAVVTDLLLIDERLVRSILRCALAARIQPVHDYDRSEEQQAAIASERAARQRASVDAERRWLDGTDGEPVWPEFPSRQLIVRKGLRLSRLFDDDVEEPAASEPPPTALLESQGAALWLRELPGRLKASCHPWLLDLVRAYFGWTVVANGAGLDKSTELDRAPTEWNNAFLGITMRAAAHFHNGELMTMVGELVALPDRSLFDTTAPVILGIDQAYFDNELSADLAVQAKQAIATRIVDSAGWQRSFDRRSFSVETHLGPAVAAVFMNSHGGFSPPRTYILRDGIGRVDPFLPMLRPMLSAGPTFFVALLTLNLMEVAPQSGHLDFVLEGAEAWLQHFSDDANFWVDQGIGRRVVRFITAVIDTSAWLQNGQDPLRARIDALLAHLVRIGVAEAHEAEKELEVSTHNP